MPAYPTPPLETTGRNGFLLNTDFSPRSALSPPAFQAPGRPPSHLRPCAPLPHRRPGPPPAAFIPEPFLHRAANGKRDARSHRGLGRRRCRPDTRPGRRGLPSPTGRARGRPTAPVPGPGKGAGVGRALRTPLARPPAAFPPRSRPSRRRERALSRRGPRSSGPVTRATRRVGEGGSGFANDLFSEIEYLKLR